MKYKRYIGIGYIVRIMEINLEAPAEIAEEIGKVLVQCMEKAGAVFCKRAKLSADLTIGDYWIHE